MDGLLDCYVILIGCCCRERIVHAVRGGGLSFSFTTFAIVGVLIALLLSI